MMKIDIGNGTNQGNCKVCGKKTGDYVRKQGKETHCCFEHIHKLKEVE